MLIRRQNNISDWQLYGRLLSYVLPYWYFFALSIVGYALYSLGNVLLADLFQFLLDAINGSGNAGVGMISGLTYRLFPDTSLTPVELARIAVPAALLLLTCLRALGFFIGSYFINHVARNLVHALRCELFEKMLVAPSAYYDGISQGALISKLTFNVEQVTGAATKALKIVLRETLTVSALLCYMAYVNWRLCLIFIAVAPLIALVVTVVGKRFRRYSRRIQVSMGDVTQVSRESIAAIREVRMFGGQAQQRERFRRASDYNRAQSLKLALAEALSTPVVQMLLAAALAALVWMALSPGLLQSFSAGSLAAFLVAAGQVGKPIRQLSGVQSIIQRGLAAAEDIFEQLDQEAECDRGSYSTDRAAGAIDIEQVSFRHQGASALAIDNVSLHITAGQTVALVGRSGSGKSTLVGLLTRFYPVQDGVIRLDDHPIEDYQLENLRGHIAMVSQDVPLFRDSVHNNIAYGALSSSSAEQVVCAAQAAQAHDFIVELPQGYDTELGDDGAGLSGGQRQRIAIARAILKGAPVLVLDEATSALDYESEHRVQRALESIKDERTTIVVAHRLSTVEQADLIVVMEEGRINATGTHGQLLEQGGLYAQLYRHGFPD